MQIHYLIKFAPKLLLDYCFFSTVQVKKILCLTSAETPLIFEQFFTFSPKFEEFSETYVRLLFLTNNKFICYFRTALISRKKTKILEIKRLNR